MRVPQSSLLCSYQPRVIASIFAASVPEFHLAKVRRLPNASPARAGQSNINEAAVMRWIFNGYVDVGLVTSLWRSAAE